MNVHSTTLGGLSCQVVDSLPESHAPHMVVILCHGFGAPGTDLVPLAGELLKLQPELESAVRFMFPAAPLSLDQMGMYGGRAWWYLDVARLAAAVETGEIRDLRNNNPEGLPEASQMLRALVDEVQQQTNLPTSRLVLGGFSQGSMVATNVTLELPENPAGLCIFSGTLLCEQKWKELIAGRNGIPVLQSHGRQDPILPFQAAEWLRDLLSNAGMQVEFIPFDGMHTIPLEAVDRFADMLHRLAKKSAE